MEQKEIKPWYKKWWGVILALVFLPFFLIWWIWAKTTWKVPIKIILSAVIFIGYIGIVNNDNKTTESTNTTDTKVETSSTPAPTEAPKVLTMDDKLWEAVGTNLKGKNGNSISYDDKTKTVTFEHAEETPYSGESFVRNSFGFFVLWGQKMVNVDGVDVLSLNYKTNLTDQYGNKGLESGVIIEMSKETFNKFNWKNLEYTPVYNTFKENSSMFFVHPAILKEVKDMSKLYLTF